MKKLPQRLLIVVGALALALPPASMAQEFFRDFGTSRSSGGIGPVIPSEYTYEDGSPSGLSPLRPGQELTNVEVAEEEEKYNFALGPFRMTMAVGAGLEWNDNIRLSDENRESDFIFRPTADLEARWRISELNTLRFNVQASYAKYFEHSELDTDGILISPNSELALTFFVGNIKFTIRDRFSYQEDTYDLPQLSGVSKYERYENQAGIQMDWQINQQLNLAAGYDHYNLWTTQDTFSTQDRAVDTIYLRPGYQLTPAIKVGLSAAYSWINFDDADRADGNNLMVGPFIEYQLSEYTNLYLEAGLQNMSYDGGTDFNNSALRELRLTDEERDAIGDILRETEDDSTSTYYVKFELQNKPSDVFRHRLSGSKTAEVGFGSNYYDLYHVEYDAEWKINEKTEMGPVLFYEYYETSGDGGEEAHRYGAAFGVRHHLSNSLTLGLDYRFLLKESNLESADYYQNLALLSLYYKF
ncbi:MAG TPA: outer membrane beta-barrel protein [Chthoniobacteraceae bacterium]|jgi:hypothetical protein